MNTQEEKTPKDLQEAAIKAKLEAIQKKMQADPRLGNYYMWYYGVYKVRKESFVRYEAAINEQMSKVGASL